MANVAAQLSSWSSRWQRNTPGPLMSPAGNDPDGGTGDLIGLKVEIFINSAWTDVTQYVRRGGTIVITRGRADETSQVQPQTARMTLDNRDGRFSARNPVGPYYGQLTRNTPLRVSRLANGIRRYRFHGEIPAWPTTSDISGRDVTVTVTASGMLRRLRAGNQPLRSAMFRAFTIRYTNADYGISPPATPVGYWPCEDGSSATQIASGLNGGTAMTVSGFPSFAANSDFPGSAPIPQLNGSTWDGAVSTVSNPTGNVWRFLLSVPAAGEANNSVVVRMTTTGTIARVELVYSTSFNGALTLNGYSSAGAQLFTSSPFSVDTGFNGTPFIMRVHLNPDVSPGVVDWEVYAVSPLNLSKNGGALGTVSGSIGSPQRVTINPSGILADTAVGHIVCQSSPDDDDADAIFNVNIKAALGWIGESPLSRLIRLCGEQNVPALPYSTPPFGDPGDETTMGTQGVDTFGNLLQQVPDALYTPMFEARDQMSLVLRDKSTMHSQAAKLTLDMAQHHLSGPLVPQDDDQLTRNDVTASRTGGSSYEAALTSGSMSTQLPPAGIGSYPYNYDLSLGSDSLLPGAAGWRLHFGTVDEPRYPQIPVNVRYFAGNVTMTNALLTVDIGDRLDVINPPPPEFPPDPISQIVQGYTETLSNYEHGIIFNCSPASPWNVGYTDDLVYGHADTDGSTLVGDYPLGTETTLRVATTGAAAGSPLWTTSAGDFPFDINVGGERMTVTNITGAASPQTFTVTRSVNTVVKTQTAGTDVRLWQPMYTSV